MSTIADTIYYILANNSAVAALVTDRINAAGDVPEKTALPHITYQLISNPATYHITGNSDFRFAREQVNCNGTDLVQARAVADAVYPALDRLSGPQGRPGSLVTISSLQLANDLEIDDPPSDATDRGPFRVILEFEIWYRE